MCPGKRRRQSFEERCFWLQEASAMLVAGVWGEAPAPHRDQIRALPTHFGADFTEYLLSLRTGMAAQGGKQGFGRCKPP